MRIRLESRHSFSDNIGDVVTSQREWEMRYEHHSYGSYLLHEQSVQFSKKPEIYCVNISIYPCVHNQTNGIVHVAALFHTHTHTCRKSLATRCQNRATSTSADEASREIVIHTKTENSSEWLVLGNFFLSRQSFYILSVDRSRCTSGTFSA